MTMLGFSTVQYFAICRPLQHLYVVRRRKVLLFLGVTWATSLVGGCAPLAALFFAVRGQPCADWLVHVVATVVRCGVDVDAAFLAVVHGIVVIMCALIYRRMRVIRAEMNAAPVYILSCSLRLCVSFYVRLRGIRERTDCEEKL